MIQNEGTFSTKQAWKEIGMLKLIGADLRSCRHGFTAPHSPAYAEPVRSASGAKQQSFPRFLCRIDTEGARAAVLPWESTPPNSSLSDWDRSCSYQPGCPLHPSGWCSEDHAACLALLRKLHTRCLEKGSNPAVGSSNSKTYGGWRYRHHFSPTENRAKQWLSSTCVQYTNTHGDHPVFSLDTL